ncbi:MAG: hypothetical protein NUV57_03350 [archaeon]|nr:hypothetical protein [archaeon]
MPKGLLDFLHHLSVGSGRPMNGARGNNIGGSDRRKTSLPNNGFEVRSSAIARDMTTETTRYKFQGSNGVFTGRRKNDVVSKQVVLVPLKKGEKPSLLRRAYEAKKALAFRFSEKKKGTNE